LSCPQLVCNNPSASLLARAMCSSCLVPQNVASSGVYTHTGVHHNLPVIIRLPQRAAACAIVLLFLKSLESKKKKKRRSPKKTHVIKKSETRGVGAGPPREVRKSGGPQQTFDRNETRYWGNFKNASTRVITTQGTHAALIMKLIIYYIYIYILHKKCMLGLRICMQLSASSTQLVNAA